MEIRPIEQKSVLKLLSLTGAGALALSLAGCASVDNEKPSTVISHEYQEGHFISVKPMMWDDEDYVLNLEQCGYNAEDLRVDENGCVTDSLEVSLDTYNTVKDGESITYTTSFAHDPEVVVVPQ